MHWLEEQSCAAWHDAPASPPEGPDEPPEEPEEDDAEDAELPELPDDPDELLDAPESGPPVLEVEPPELEPPDVDPPVELVDDVGCPLVEPPLVAAGKVGWVVDTAPEEI